MEIEEEWGTERVYLRMENDRTARVASGKIAERELLFRDMPNTTVEKLIATHPADAERWSALIRASPARDVYYLPAYVRANSEIEQSEPMAIVAGSDACRILAPLLIRP